MVDKTSPKRMEAIKGRLSFNKLTADEAFAEAATGPFPVKTVQDAKPYANLLLTQSQYERVLAKITGEYFPYCASQYKISDKEKDALSPADIKGLLQQLEDGEGPFNTPFKQPSEKTLALMPDCAVMMKLIGNAGSDFEVQAIANDQSELAVPDPDMLKKAVLPIADTKHTLYRGCWVISPINLYRYRNGKNPGFSAGSNFLVFSKNDTPFSGGGQLDQDSVFLADEED